MYQLSSKTKNGHVVDRSQIDEICPLAIPNQVSTISMHMPSLVKIHRCLQIHKITFMKKKVIFQKPKNVLLQADLSAINWWNLPTSNSKDWSDCAEYESSLGTGHTSSYAAAHFLLK